LLLSRGEFFAAGWFELPGAPLVCRMGRAMRRQLERCALPPLESPLQPLYPAGAYAIWDQGAAVRFHYSYPFNFDPGVWEQHVQACPDECMRARLRARGQALARYPSITEVLPLEFRLGGNGYTHSIVHYGRVVAEGLDRYIEHGSHGSIRMGTDQQGNEIRSYPSRSVPSVSHSGACLYRALQDLLIGMRTYHARAISHLETSPPSLARDRLLDALRRVPWQPARNFYEGLVAVNFVYYLDGCDNLGRFDQVLGALYEADLDAGRLAPEEGERLVRCMWRNVDDNNGWNAALGGTTANGGPAYNQLTVTCLRAAQGMRRPNLALRVRRDMPQQVWEAALEAIASGCGLPALYNEEAYLAALQESGLIPDAGDLADYAFGGCTETMVHGKSNVGSLDAGINLPQVLTGTLARTLPTALTFAALMQEYERDLAAAIARLAAAVNCQQQRKAAHHPQLMRTLLVDDCLERGVEFNAGGARYNWSVINVAGIGNVVDALAAVREVVFARREVTGKALWAALAANYQGHEALRQRLSCCPRFGNDDPAADELAADLSAFVFRQFARHTPWRGGRFLPACLMFVTYAEAGKGVMATPDGRLADAPIADSAGPVAGRDRRGPTAMMCSVSRLDMCHAPGTLVVNMRLNRQMLAGPEARAKTQALIRSYFALGNMQLQVNVVDQATLEAALADPESYRDLVVRVGGYSEYFVRLTSELQRTVLERTIHAV
jgi:formate C-acetyltransferase